MTSVDRTIEFIEFKKINKSSFYKVTGLSNGYLDKVKELGADKILSMLSVYPELNVDWLITGKGDMIKKKEGLLTIDSENAGYLQKYGIPLIPVEAMAGIGGNGGLQIHQDDIQDYFVIPQLSGIADCAFTVSGDSMSTTYLRGDYVICKRIMLGVDFIQWNKAYVLDTEQGNLVKRLKKSAIAEHFLCHSDNVNFDPFDIPLKDVRNMAIVLAVIRLD